ncbi:MAG: hypothetical protein IJU57_05985 [Clostridia bacterium]|nr:hypothetical protein [Clostridia bacterium]
MQAVYRLCGLNIAVSTVWENTHMLMRDYLSTAEELEEGIEFFVATSAEDIDFERKRSDESHASEDAPPSYTDGYLEELAVLRKISEKLPAYDSFLFHGSSLCYDGKAYIFTARSGVGKSTHASLWRKLLGERVTMINDDKPFISVNNGVSYVHGNPYNGKHRLGNNITVPLSAVCLIKRGCENRIRKVSLSEAFPALMLQAYRPADPVMLAKTLELLDAFTASCGLYELECNMDIEAARVSFEKMTGEVVS